MHILGPDGRPIEQALPVFDEVSSAARDDIAGSYVHELRAHQDKILSLLPDGVAAYKKLLDDDQVQSTYQQRRRAITSREWDVKPGGDRPIDEEAAAWTKEQLEHVDFGRVVDKMHFGVFYGYAVAELIYVREGSRVNIDAIKVRDRTRFRWDRDFWLRLLTPENPYAGERMPARKFWTFATGSDHDDDPYGIGLAHYLYWPVYFKRTWTKDWLIFGEKFAAPVPIGKYEPGTLPAEQKKLLQSLAAIRTDLGVVIPNTMEIDKFEALRTGTGTYEPFFDKMNAAIAKVVLSQTMTTDAASTGLGSTQGSVQAEVAEDVQQSDAKLILGSFSSGTPFSEAPLNWLIEWNFSGAAVPRVEIIFDEEEDLTEVSERLVKLNQVGYRPTQEKVTELFGDGFEPANTPPTAPGLPAVPGQAEFAEADRTTADELAGRAEGTMMDGMIEPIRKLLGEASSLEDFRDRLIAQFSELDGDRLGHVLMQAMLTAELAGRYEAQEGE